MEKLFRSGLLKPQRQKKDPQLSRNKKVIILSGPTGTGKSAMGLMLAEAIGGEIVSADSMQVYRGMNIGTAKVSEDERKTIPHHLIDIRDVKDVFNVVDFYYEARQACQRILDRDGIPIIVGGTGFYIHALMYGPPCGPPSVPSLRKAIEEEIENKGSELLYERLQKMDPRYAETITVHDKHKIVRALEIITLTGERVSQLSWKDRLIPLDYQFHCWFLHRPRATLYKRIEKRCGQMLRQGLIEEVKGLIPQGIRSNPSASQAIGYRHCLKYLESEQSEKDYEFLVKSLEKDTRHYAKRQFTWWRREAYFRWLDLDLHDPETAVSMIMTDYERS
ncbi:MAG: tRNA (adenosine(37)-N6)-dimethylallyltransferase MiaA [Chlamydiales bacterium]